MMKPIDDEKRGLKLESLMELIKEMKSGSLDKMPKGKGISMMSVSISKPKKKGEEMEEEMPEMEEGMEMAEAPEMEEGMEMAEEAPKMEEEPSEEMEEGMEMAEAPEMEEDEFELPEPAIPEDLMKLVMEMMKNKQKG
jgi:hypothetical protein